MGPAARSRRRRAPTTFEAEAEPFTAKAQELMARHAIDRAVLDHESGAGERPEGRRLGIDDPYVTEKSVLLSEVADANRCRCVWSKSLGLASLFGFGPDLDAVEVLYTSLLVQASTAMMAAGARQAAGSRSRSPSFRRSFLLGFATRIGERLRAATDAGVAQAAATHGGTTALVPVLAERAEAVEQATRAAFPRVREVPLRSRHLDGVIAGQLAADRASLAAGRPLRR